MNDFIPARRVELTRTRDDTVNVTVELENDAVLTLAVTDKGSERVGLREYVELRAGDATVSMSNASSYKAETSTRVVRQARINRMRPYALMYKAIARAICRGEPGDSIDSIQIPTEIMLDLEDQLQSQRR